MTTPIFWLCPMRIKLDKILVHNCLEICMLSKSMPPMETFVNYWIHLSLSTRCIEDWDFSEKEHVLYCNYIFSIYFLACLYPKNTKTPLLLLLLFPINLLTNTFSSLWVRQPFLYWKVLQLISSTWESSSIKNVFWRRCRGRRIRFFTYVSFSFTSDFAIVSLAVLVFLSLWRRLVKQKWFMFLKSRI
jgi:hypothetical protein